MIKHTPGPLFVKNDEKHTISIVDGKGRVVHGEYRQAWSSSQKTVEDVMTGRHMNDQCAAVEANARQLADMYLRAAGPELFDAVNLVLKSFAYRPGEGPEWYEACRLATGKAKGEA